jgi:hypothetical protein
MVWRKTLKPDWEVAIKCMLVDCVATSAWTYLICTYVINIHFSWVLTYLFNCLYYLGIWLYRRLTAWQ